MQMFSVNNRLSPEVETVFLMSSPKYSFLSSSIAKEVARYGGEVKGLVPENIQSEMLKKFPPRA
jgi:pantetheine-phosphate adenylyltransferase